MSTTASSRATISTAARLGTVRTNEVRNGLFPCGNPLVVHGSERLFIDRSDRRSNGPTAATVTGNSVFAIVVIILFIVFIVVFACLLTTYQRSDR